MKSFETISGSVQLRTIFIRSAWGPVPERLRYFREIEEEILSGKHPDISHKEFNDARQDGQKAFELEEELNKIFQREGADSAKRWISQTTISLNYRIRGHLEHQLNKPNGLIDGQKIRNEKYRRPQYITEVKTTLLNGGLHPNSLSQQEPKNNWDIFIDETGEVFDQTLRGASISDASIGKVVALAVPEGVILEPLNRFHATESSDQQVDSVLQHVLDAQVGILGFSIHDRSTHQRYWIGHVIHLIRWTLLQLPVPIKNTGCNINIYIENRDEYVENTNLSTLRAALESEVSALDPERYAHLNLNLQIMTKNHPMNGYVDAVAFTWGSSSRISKNRLANSLLCGHCLIEANETSVHHLYLALSQQGPLSPVDWYTLCSATVKDGNSFLTRALEKLGQNLKKHPDQWRQLLNEVQSRLQSKQYVLSELGCAISWLQQYASETDILPVKLQLQLLSSNIALTNHQGRIDKERVLACLELANQVHDEAPQLACEALLRVSSSLTNNFQFDAKAAVNHINKWLDEPVAVAGLLNYGKLQSTKGQLLAFQGKSQKAIPYFEQALLYFSRLSDPMQVKRECRQTDVYRLIAMMEVTKTDFSVKQVPPSLFRDLMRHWDGKTEDKISAQMAQSLNADRFDHHLWVRALTYFPTELSKARQSYLDQSNKWYEGDGHPWPLISAYRAWMLYDAGDIIASHDHLRLAIHTCGNAPHGNIFLWMAEVLRILATALTIDFEEGNSNIANRKNLQNLIPHAPHEALLNFERAATGYHMTHSQIISHLNACLPFNFH